jgi:hypothetical protein
MQRSEHLVGRSVQMRTFSADKDTEIDFHVRIRSLGFKNKSWFLLV